MTTAAKFFYNSASSRAYPLLNLLLFIANGFPVIISKFSDLVSVKYHKLSCYSTWL